MAVSAFLIIQLQRPGSRVISQPGCAAENTPLCQIVLCPSNLHGSLRISLVMAEIEFFAELVFAEYPAGIRVDHFEFVVQVGNRDKWIIIIAAVAQVDEPHLRQDLLGQSGVGLQTAMAVQVGVEDARQESSIGVIGMGVGAALAIAVALCGLGRDQIDEVATVE